MRSYSGICSQDTGNDPHTHPVAVIVKYPHCGHYVMAMEYLRYEGCYIGIAEEGFPLICDLYPDGVFVASSVTDGKFYPFGYGSYEITHDNKFIVPKKKARLMMILNNEDATGEITAKGSLKLSGAVMYYAGEINRTVFDFDLESDENPLPDDYMESVRVSYEKFDFTKYDFGKLDAEAAMEMAKAKPETKKESDGKFVPTRADYVRLCDNKGRMIEGAYFDDAGNVCYREVELRRFITQEEASKTGDWSNVSWNIEADTAKEKERVAAINRANRARAAGTFDANKDYSKEE